MTCKNYYKMTGEEIVQSLHTIREWIWNFPKHEKTPKAWFALQVCHSAHTIKRDSFIELLIDNIT